ncbi:MAG: group III truncated hemoglobin, partial [Microthrixaceae bacterium]
QLLGERGYVGQPLLAHRAVVERVPFGAEHFERWIDLFDETVDEHFCGPVAELAHGRARKMAAALQRLLRGGVDRDDPGEAPVAVTLAGAEGSS